jgi:glycine betaine transporter
MISFAKIDGIKMLSNLGGVSALILGLFTVFALIKVARNPEKYDVASRDEINEGQETEELKKVM